MKRTTSLSIMLLAAALLPAVSVQAEPEATGFKPPQLGTPSDRIGGGTRDIGKIILDSGLNDTQAGSEQIQLLASHQTGLTSLAAPTLYWYAPTISPYHFEITVQQSGKPVLLKKDMGVVKTAGIQKIRLADYGIQLIAGLDYTWSVTSQHTTDSQTNATIRYQQPATLLTDTAQMIKAGYWYDAVAQLAESHSPQLTELLQQEGISIQLDK